MKLYIYGVIDSNGEIDRTIKGIKGTPVGNIPYRDIGVAVGRFEDLRDIRKTNSLEHEDVVEALMKRFTVLPFRFHTLFDKEERILSILEDHYSDFRENLDRLRNKGEFGIKVIWPGERIKTQIEREYGRNHHAATEASNSTADRYIEEKFEKYKIEKEFEEKAEICIAIVDNFLNRFAAEKKLEKTKSKDLLLSAFYLVEKGKQKDFKEALDILKIAPGDFKYLSTGPWPPYNFIRLGYNCGQDGMEKLCQGT